MTQIFCRYAVDHAASRRTTPFPQYFHDYSRRRTFHGNWVAASFRDEMSRLRDTSAALVLAQQPSFSVGLRPRKIPAFQCHATICCIYVRIRAAKAAQDTSAVSTIARESADTVLSFQEEPGCHDARRVSEGETGSGDSKENFVIRARLLNAVFAAADELAAAHGVDKASPCTRRGNLVYPYTRCLQVRTHAKQWIGAGGLRAAAMAHHSSPPLQTPSGSPHEDIAALGLEVVRFAVALQARNELILLICAVDLLSILPRSQKSLRYCKMPVSLDTPCPCRLVSARRRPW